MRARDRSAVERRARALAPGVRVVWCRDLPHGTHGVANQWSRDEGWIYLSERAWNAANALERLDTLAHEIAHILAWRKHGLGIEPHGREWRRIFRSLTKALA